MRSGFGFSSSPNRLVGPGWPVEYVCASSSSSSGKLVPCLYVVVVVVVVVVVENSPASERGIPRVPFSIIKTVSDSIYTSSSHQGWYQTVVMCFLLAWARKEYVVR